jgi:hypothetical protein
LVGIFLFFYFTFQVREQCCGSGMFIPDPTFFHSRIRIVSILDPGSASKNFSILTNKNGFLSSRKYDPGCSSRITDLDPDFYPSRIPDPGVKKAPDPRSATLFVRVYYKTLSQVVLSPPPPPPTFCILLAVWLAKQRGG